MYFAEVCVGSFSLLDSKPSSCPPYCPIDAGADPPVLYWKFAPMV